MYHILLYYHFTTILDPEAFSKRHLKYCQKLGILGRIIVSSEGINGTVCGRLDQTESYMNMLKTILGFESTEFKIDESQEQIFKRISIKVKKEIVTLGLKDDIDPKKLTGVHVSPETFYHMLQEKDVVVLDSRNKYEYDLGHFKGAIRPDIKTFKQLPKWVNDHKHYFEGKRVLTYCTGGVRCEKFSGFLLKEGIKEVYQLHGGIIQYGKNHITKGNLFEGVCYVFDPRTTVKINHVNPSITGKDYFTKEPSDRYINCANPYCNKKLICTKENEVLYRGSCCETCRSHPKNVFDTRPIQ